MLNILFTDYVGNQNDCAFINKEDWLTDAWVTSNIMKYHGEWKIRLVFIWTKNPLRMICRYINDVYTTESKAEIFARFFARTAQKNSKSLESPLSNDFNICYN